MKSICLLIFLVYSCFVSAVEIQSEFSLDTNVSSVVEGDLVQATLKVWPLESADKSEFSKLQNSLMFNSFQLIQIQSIEPSSNNADVIELKGTFIIRASKYLTTFQLNYHGQIIPVEPPRIKVVPLGKKAEDFFVLEQSLSYSHFKKILFLSLLGLIILMALIKRKKIIHLIRGYKKDPRAEAIKYFDNKFLKASNRAEFEEIYAKRNEWMPLLKIQTSAYKEFFSVINQHQYKPVWTNGELKEVQSVFDVIRRSFK